jgi:hypothetical protein
MSAARPIPRFRKAVFAAGILALPLAGCMSAGSSSFSDALDVRPQQNSAEALPMDVANAGVVDATAAQPSSLPGVAPQMTAAQQEIAADPLAAKSLAGEQELEVTALAPETDARAQSTEAQFAAIAPADAPLLSDVPSETPRADVPATGEAMAALPAEPAIDPVTGEPIEVIADPLEVAADERATALYASMKHGQCSGGWGPKPKMINAKRIDPTHKYYMEMRLRHTPPLPVGHVYIAYGRIGPDGEALDEKLVMLAPVGGYAGATMAAAAPMPGVLEPYGDDCVLRPIAAYRISLNAQQYEKLLGRIVQAQQDKPRYALWTYNCNHFMSDVAASVGILPPKNKYTPSLEYFYAMMDRNEGRKVARSQAADTAQLAQN